MLARQARQALRLVSVPLRAPLTTLRAPVVLPCALCNHAGKVRRYAAPATAPKPVEAPNELETEAEAAEGDGGLPALSNRYADLKGRIRYPIWKAITVRPYNYKEMTDVQQAVFSLFPQLAASPSSEPNYKDVEKGVADPLLQAQDLLVRAKTGTGKTIAFMVPIIEGRIRQIESFRAKWKADNPTLSGHHLAEATKAFLKSSTGALILSPTRELATQIATEASALTDHLDDWGVRLFVGGASKAQQLHRFRRDASNIIVATPGRCLDLIQNDETVRERIANSRALVLDEADTLLDMGFSDELNQVVDVMKPKEERQTFLFSATVSPAIRQIARRFLKKEHVFINTVRPEDIDVHMHIPQTVTVLPSPEDQVKHVLRLIAQDQLEQGILNRTREFKKPGKTIVFLPTTKLTQLFAITLDTMRTQLPSGLRSRIFEISSRKDQRQRERASDMFRKTQDVYSILVTSDVSARGVDYPDVTRVIQVGIPSSRDIYIHRIGRTGRAGKKGRGDLVLLPWEAGFVKSELRDLPLNPLTVDELKSQVAQMTPGAVDADGKPLNEETESGFSNKFFSKDIARRLNNLDEVLETNVLPTFDDGSISEAFTSMLGYYFGKTSELKASKRDILDGLKEWTVKAMGRDEPPHVSPAFLERIGFSARDRSPPSRRGGGFGGGRGGGGFSRRYDDRNDGGRGRFDDRNDGGRGRRFEDRFDGDRRGGSSSSSSGRTPSRWEGRGSAGGRERQARSERSFGARGESSYERASPKKSWFDD